jgi:hypothetical protein
MLLKEVSFVLKQDYVHKAEGIGYIVHLVITGCSRGTVSNKLDLLAHKH